MTLQRCVSGLAGAMSIRRAVIRKLNTIRAGAIDALEEVGAQNVEYNRRATSNWRGRPRFSVQVQEDGHGIELHVRATGENASKFAWVDQGTGRWGPNRSPYKIPRVAGDEGVRFQTGYNAKTAPIARANVGDGSYSGGWVTKKQIEHPGIRPREFTETFVEDFTPEIMATLREHIARQMRR